MPDVLSRRWLQYCDTPSLAALGATARRPFALYCSSGHWLDRLESELPTLSAGQGERHDPLSILQQWRDLDLQAPGDVGLRLYRCLYLAFSECFLRAENERLCADMWVLPFQALHVGALCAAAFLLHSCWQASFSAVDEWCAEYGFLLGPGLRVGAVCCELVAQLGRTVPMAGVCAAAHYALPRACYWAVHGRESLRLGHKLLRAQNTRLADEVYLGHYLVRATCVRQLASEG